MQPLRTNNVSRNKWYKRQWVIILACVIEANMYISFNYLVYNCLCLCCFSSHVKVHGLHFEDILVLWFQHCECGSWFQYTDFKTHDILCGMMCRTMKKSKPNYWTENCLVRNTSLLAELPDTYFKGKEPCAHAILAYWEYGCRPTSTEPIDSWWTGLTV